MKVKFLHAQIDMNSRQRPEGYLAAFAAKATNHPTHWEISREDYTALDLEYPIQRFSRPLPPAPTPMKPVAQPPEKWPCNAFGFMARGMKLLKQDGDAGVGDTLARIVGPVGGDIYKKWFLDTFGKSCGCEERQEKLNEIFPYEKTN